MITSGMNLVMTVIGFAMSTMFIVFVCTRLVCARIHLNAARRSFPVASRSDLGILERGYHHGLDPVVVANFPTKEYNNELFSTTEDAQCSICLAEYRQSDILRILPYCGHSFHVTCIDIWLKQHSTCPVCRIPLHEFLERKRAMQQPLFSSAIRSQDSRAEVGFEVHPYSCLYIEHGFSSRQHNDSSETESNTNNNNDDESHQASDRDEAKAGESLSLLVEGKCESKDLGSKHAESPSNP
ncbi:unnamed protein product [Linum trigynum]|uniref:RING-type E3 ubiquitin transferase n=1 Tax=Linum trigynum TaxID=586398 RepID=A0AAV2DKA7_9ROSI